MYSKPLYTDQMIISTWLKYRNSNYRMQNNSTWIQLIINRESNSLCVKTANKVNMFSMDYL